MNSKEARRQMTVWWVLWAAFQIDIFVLYYFLSISGGRTETQAMDSPVWLAGFAPFALSTIVRWLILPRVRNAKIALPLLIIGIAMAEATCFLGIFIFPVHKQELFIWSVVGVFQFIPYFVSRYFKPDDEGVNG